MRKYWKHALLFVLGAALLVVLAEFALGPIVVDADKDWNATWSHRTGVQLAKVARDIDEFSRKAGRKPTSLLDVYQSPPIDPWGQELSYQLRADGTCSLRSAGPDKRFGSKDDIARNVDLTSDAHYDKALRLLEQPISSAPESDGET